MKSLRRYLAHSPIIHTKENTIFLCNFVVVVVVYCELLIYLMNLPGQVSGHTGSVDPYIILGHMNLKILA